MVGFLSKNLKRPLNIGKVKQSFEAGPSKPPSKEGRNHDNWCRPQPRFPQPWQLLDCLQACERVKQEGKGAQAIGPGNGDDQFSDEKSNPDYPEQGCAVNHSYGGSLTYESKRLYKAVGRHVVATVP